MRTPKYRKHSSRDIGFAEFRGERKYFPGHYKSAESNAAYRAFLRSHVFGESTPEKPAAQAVPVSFVVLKFLQYALAYYGEGKRGEFENLRGSLFPFEAICGSEPAATFGPLKLKAYRQTLIESGKARAYVNQIIGRIKRCFGWAVSEEIIPATNYDALRSVPSLEAGRTEAKETPAREPVPWEHVAPVLAELSPMVRTMVEFQWLVGCRSRSLCLATPSQFTREGDILLWRPRHKMERKKKLILPIGPKAQALIAPYLKGCEPGEFIFNPQKQRSNRRYNKRYSSGSYAYAVRRAIKRAGVPHWSPHQLRHSKGHAVRSAHGIEAEQAVLGHSSLKASEVYSEPRLELAKRIAREDG